MKMENLMAVNTNNENTGNILGKFLYFSFSNILIERSELEDICSSVNFPIDIIGRTSLTDAFRNATGDIYDRIVDKSVNGIDISRIYCRDNKKIEKDVISRELVEETLDEETNIYTKLANINYDKSSDHFSYGNFNYDSNRNIYEYCDRARKLFNLYRTCSSKRQIEGLVNRYIAAMNAVKISVHGHLFFVPKATMYMVEVLEDFIEELNRHNKVNEFNKVQNTITVNSMYVVDDAKQRSKMADEFYANVKKDIEMYQERIEYLIKSNSQSPAIMERWIIKIEALEQKKRIYEDILKQELDDLDDEFNMLKFLGSELKIRVRNKRAA